MAAGAVLELVPEGEEEDVGVPVQHLFLEIFGAAVDAAEALQAAETEEGGLRFAAGALDRTAEGGGGGLVGGEGVVEAGVEEVEDGDLDGY